MPIDRISRLRRAVSCLEAGDFATAEHLSAGLVAADREDGDAQATLAVAVGACGDAERAAPLLVALARAHSAEAHPCRDVARLLARHGRAHEAGLVFHACLRLTPDDRSLHYAHADILHETGRLVAALAAADELAARWPDFDVGHNLRGLILGDLGRFEEARQAFRRAIAIDDQAAEPWSNLGMVTQILGDFTAAQAAYDTAIALAPADWQIRVNRAVALLREGRLAEAWGDYEARLRRDAGRLPMPAPPLPRITDLDLRGRSVVAVHTDGFGDTLQFMRYLPLLAARGADVLAVIPSELLRLARSMKGAPEITDVAVFRAADRQFDFSCVIPSLPRVFTTTLDTIPSPIPYIAAEAELIDRWRLPPGDTLRVGLAWAGQSRPWLPGFEALDRRRSTHLSTFAPLARIAGVRLISLQKGAAACQIRETGAPILDPMEHVGDFADTAAIVAQLELVVTVDTSIAHLAGALGKPVFLADRFDSCWRWLHGREDSPWYPTVRIFRQPSPGDWDSVVQRIGAAIEEIVTGRATPPDRSGHPR